MKCAVVTAAAAAMAVSGTLAIAGATAGRPALERTFKPLTTLLLLPVLGWPGDAPTRWMALGIGFSALGDVALLWRSDRAFVRGLGAFFAAHLAYIAGFLLRARWSAVTAVALPALAIATLVSLRVLWPRVHRLRPWIIAYAVALTAMVASAAASVDSAVPSTWFALPGAVLFYASDGCLAWNRFVRRIPAAPLLILSLYWLGQFGIASASGASREVPCQLSSHP